MHRILFFFREHRRGVDARRRRRDTPAARPADSIRSAPVKTERGGEEKSRGGVGFDRRAREVAGNEVQRRGSPELREKAPVAKLDGALVREHEGDEGRLLPRSSRPEEARVELSTERLWRRR